MKKINNFKDPKYSFLMNSYPVTIGFQTAVYKTAEHAYQSAKTTNVSEKNRIKSAQSARDAKRIGRSITIKPTWDSERIGVMRKIIKQKFKNKDLRQKLLSTGNAELIAGGDRFWGVRDGRGLNHLGNLIMDERKQILDFNTSNLNGSLRFYLTECGWTRDSSGDGIFGECWTPPWDSQCQYSLFDAAIEQKRKVK